MAIFNSYVKLPEGISSEEHQFFLKLFLTCRIVFLCVGVQDDAFDFARLRISDFHVPTAQRLTISSRTDTWCLTKLGTPSELELFKTHQFSQLHQSLKDDWHHILRA